ncbi:MAG TPA: hypothetical protein VGB17_06935 [Pyrinomonadaceae bacterium]|jgi:hypothetical protein
MSVSDLIAVPLFFAKRLAEGANVVALIGDRVYDGDIPDVTRTFDPYPCCLVAYQGGADTQTTNARRVMAKPLYLVELVTKGPLTTGFKAALKEMDDLLQQCTNYEHEDIPNFFFHSWREQASSRSSIDTAIGKFKFRGGFYRVEAIPTN